jgi:E3 ubiquitin-protein ligase RGLG
VTIADRFRSLEEVQQGLREAGLESSNLIIGVDFTGSNQETGRVSFGGRCLHDTTGPPNPYQQVMEIAGRTLESFDDDHLIPAFGFGDVHTRDKSCFPFHSDGRPCRGLQEVLSRYREIALDVHLSGPTNFAPIIDKAIEILVAAGRTYHILLIIGDGQVTAHPSRSNQGKMAALSNQHPHHAPLTIASLKTQPRRR